MTIKPEDIEEIAEECEAFAQECGDPVPDRCDPEIYEFGSVVAIAATHGAVAFEEWITAVRQFNFSDRIDWHYVAGRAVVKVIGSTKRVKKAMELLRHSCPATLTFMD
jgi:hypothetical protein